MQSTSMLTKQLTRFPGERQHTELFEKKTDKRGDNDQMAFK